MLNGRSRTAQGASQPSRRRTQCPPILNFRSVTKADLLARLADGLNAGVTVVTPNRRLAQELAREFDADRMASGLSAWEAADIVPFGTFVERLWESAVYSELGAQIPQLLSAAQEQALWEEIIEASPWGAQLMAPARAAAQCRDAWRLAQAWRIAGALEKFPGNDDARAFAEWARAYVKRTARDVDSARLPDVVAKLLTSPAIGKPRVLVAYAFDILPPQTADFFRACGAAGIEVLQCGPRRKEGTTVRATFASAREELESAARWARSRLEAAHRKNAADKIASYPRIAVVVPDLQLRRQEVARVFSRVMQPGWNLPGAAAAADAVQHFDRRAARILSARARGAGPRRARRG